jgi:hypothetical protein
MPALGKWEIIRLRLDRLNEITPLQISERQWTVPCTECDITVGMLQSGENDRGNPIFSVRYFCLGCEEVFCDRCKIWKQYCFVCAADAMNAEGELRN